MSQEFDFSDLTIIEIPVKGPNGRDYILREASSDAVAQFNNARARCVKFTDGGMSAVDGQGHLATYLVSLCLFNTNDDGSANTGSLVSLGVLRKWPERVIKPLFAKAKEISEVDDDEDIVTLRKQREELDERIKKMEEDLAKNVLNPMGPGLNSPESEVTPAASET